MTDQTPEMTTRLNPLSRWHTEQVTKEHRHSWACVPATDAVQAEAEATAALRQENERLRAALRNAAQEHHYQAGAPWHQIDWSDCPDAACVANRAALEPK